MKFFHFKPDNIFMNTLEDTTQLGSFNQHLPMRQSNNSFSYSGPHRHEDDSIGIFFSSVPAHNGTTDVDLIVVTETFLNDLYAI